MLILRLSNLLLWVRLWICSIDQVFLWLLVGPGRQVLLGWGLIAFVALRIATSDFGCWLVDLVDLTLAHILGRLVGAGNKVWLS